MTLMEALAEYFAGNLDGIITPDVAAEMITKTGGTGQVFAVSFYKKGKKNGEGKNDLREMRCRLGSTVKKGLSGGPAVYKPDEHGLIWSYLMAGDERRNDDDKNRRSISVSGITRLAIGGRTYHVTGNRHH
jgi:hypothetical protein